MRFIYDPFFSQSRYLTIQFTFDSFGIQIQQQVILSGFTIIYESVVSTNDTFTIHFFPHVTLLQFIYFTHDSLTIQFQCDSFIIRLFWHMIRLRFIDYHMWFIYDSFTFKFNSFRINLLSFNIIIKHIIILYYYLFFFHIVTFIDNLILMWFFPNLFIFTHDHDVIHLWFIYFHDCFGIHFTIIYDYSIVTFMW